MEKHSPYMLCCWQSENCMPMEDNLVSYQNSTCVYHLTQKAHFCIYIDILTDMWHNTHTLFIRALFIKAKTLETTYKGQSISKWLELVIKEQVCFFLKRKLFIFWYGKLLQDVTLKRQGHVSVYTTFWKIKRKNIHMYTHTPPNENIKKDNKVVYRQQHGHHVRESKGIPRS